MWSPNELLKIEKQRDILSYITLQFFHFKKVPLEHCPFVTSLLFFSACAVIIIADKNKEVIIMAVKIEKDTIIGDILDVAPQSAPLFFAIGMHCLGCPSSRGETVEEACMVHGVDCEPFLAQLNNFLEAYEANEAAKQNG